MMMMRMRGACMSGNKQFPLLEDEVKGETMLQPGMLLSRPSKQKKDFLATGMKQA